jgi:hypothetical protein
LSEKHATALVRIRFLTVLSESFVFFERDNQHGELNGRDDAAGGPSFFLEP